MARTRLREQARSGVFKYNGMWNTIRLIAREEGKSGMVLFSFLFILDNEYFDDHMAIFCIHQTGLYAGLGVHLMKVVPNSAIMFLTYELVNTWLSQVHISDSF